MKKLFAASFLLLLCVFIFSGCSSANEYDVAGTWRLVSLENLSIDEYSSFDEEILLLNPDGTGAQVYLPCDYNEEYSYIVWKTNDAGDTIEIKHSEEYKYDLNIIDVSDNEMEVTFFYASDENIIYSAQYEKLDDGIFDFIGRWTFTDYIQDGEHYEPDESFLYLYPDGKMEQVYYEVEEQITETGTWDKTSSYFMLIFDGYEPMRYNITLSPNKLEIYDKTQEGAEITFVYKRYYGLITNAPPAAYPESFAERISRYFTVFFD